MKFNNVLAMGTIREDIVIPVDFGISLNASEKKVDDCCIYIGGSVYNTCRYLARTEIPMRITMITRNYNKLYSLIGNCGINFIKTDKKYSKYPISIIGTQKDGNKKMISYDPISVDDQIWDLLETNIENDTLVYTSLYELPEQDDIDRWKRIIEKKKRTTTFSVMIDLCPLMKYSYEMLHTILNQVNYLSGNTEEFSCLREILKIKSNEDLFCEFPLLNIVLEKMGEQGANCIIRQVSKPQKIVEKICECSVSQNTTGCGDIFNASFIMGISLGLDNREILKNAVEASKKVAYEGIPWKLI